MTLADGRTPLIGYVPQQLSIEAALTGRENVTWFARLFDVPRRERKGRVADALEVMGLGDAADRLARDVLRRHDPPPRAGAGAGQPAPALLILDEPTVGLDPLARDGVWERVRELRRTTGMTVLLTTHYMEEADVLCDRVALMHLGSHTSRGNAGRAQGGLGPEATPRGRVPPLRRRPPSRTTELKEAW